MQIERKPPAEPDFLLAYRDHLVNELLEVESRLAGSDTKRASPELARVLNLLKRPSSVSPAVLGS